MEKLHEEFPVYGFLQHKGYPVQAHLEAIREHGVSPHHRRSYGPVKKIVEMSQNDGAAQGILKVSQKKLLKRPAAKPNSNSKKEEKAVAKEASKSKAKGCALRKV